MIRVIIHLDYHLMKLHKIIIIGAGGHARSCIDVIEQEKRFKIAGLIERKKKSSFKIFKHSIIGTNKNLKELSNKIPYALIGVGQIKTFNIRKNLYKKVVKAGFKLPIIISPEAYVSPHAKIKEGTIVMHGAIVNAGAIIGKNCIINSNALVEHDAIVGDHCHIATGAIVNGQVTVGTGSFIGSGVITKQSVSIGKNSIIGAGVFLKRDIESDQVIKN